MNALLRVINFDLFQMKCGQKFWYRRNPMLLLQKAAISVPVPKKSVRFKYKLCYRMQELLRRKLFKTNKTYYIVTLTKRCIIRIHFINFFPQTAGQLVHRVILLVVPHNRLSLLNTHNVCNDNRASWSFKCSTFVTMSAGFYDTYRK